MAARSPTPVDDPASHLPRSIFVPEEDPRREMRDAVDAILSDAFMGFLALLLIPIIVLPLVVNLSGQILTLLDLGDVTIIGFFVVEYAAKLYLAADRKAFVRSPWHILDLLVIVLSFVSYLPLLGLGGHGSTILLLRLLRLPRVFAVAGRSAGLRAGSEDASAAAAAPEPEVQVRQIDPDHLDQPHDLTWAQFEQHLSSPAPEWIHLANASESSLLRLSALLRVPESSFRYGQVDELWPHVARSERTVLLFLQSGEIRYPKRAHEYFSIARRGAIIVVQGPKVISITPHGLDPFARVADSLRTARIEPGGFPITVVEGLLETTLRDYRALFSELELEVARIGRTPRSQLPKDFLARSYELSKSITRLGTNITHLRELAQRLTSSRVPLEGVDEHARERFEALVDETSYLAEIARDAGEGLSTVIDVYINQSSFETNRVLKILAVITAVAIIPATVGGLLGIDGPYDFVLWQVLLVIGIGMLFVTYAFLKLGWLRS